MAIIDKILSLNISFINTFGYPLIFLLIFFEAAPFIGIIIPGSVILFFAGFLTKLGFFNLWIVVFLAVLGAILGDTTGYLTGKYFGKKILSRFGKYFLIKKELSEKTCQVVHAHTGKSLIIGRFNPLTRCIAPFILGIHKVSFAKFMFFNILGGVLWGSFFVLFGYLFGQSYNLAHDVEKYILIITIFLIISFYIYYNIIKTLTNKSE